MLSEPSLGLAGAYPFFCAVCTVSLDLLWALRPGYQETEFVLWASQSAHGDSSVVGGTQPELSPKGMAALLSRCVWVWEMAPQCPAHLTRSWAQPPTVILVKTSRRFSSLGTRRDLGA